MANAPNREDNPMPVPEEKKIIGLVLYKSKNPPAREITTSHPTPSITENSATTSNSATVSNSATGSITVSTNTPSPGDKCKRWGPPCPLCIQSTPHPSPVDSDQWEEDWDGEIEKEKRQEEQRKEKEMLQKQAEEKKVLSSNYYPLEPMYISNHEDQSRCSGKQPDTVPREL